jgi:protein SCO1
MSMAFTHRLLAAAGACLALLCGPAFSASPAPEPSTLKIDLPNVEVLDQDGRKRRFAADLVQGKLVAVNFIFTSCTSICTPLAATFKGVQDELARQGVSDAQLISVSVDPLNDTPDELRKFGAKFGAKTGAQANWTFVTGSRKSIDAILSAFGVSAGTSDPNDHSPIVFLGHAPSARWTRGYGLAAPAVLTRQLLELRTRPAPSAAKTNLGANAASNPNTTADAPPAAALASMQRMAGDQAQQAQMQSAAPGTRGAAYFTNLPLLTQDKPVRFYDDLVRHRIVLIHSFYANCKDVCSPLTHNLARAQRLIGEQLDKPVQLISISTDPLADVPEVLREYAQRHNAGPGWAFVTGKKENVDWVLHKLGLYQETPQAHTAILWIGNERTGHWLKLHAMAPPQAIVDAVRKVL